MNQGMNLNFGFNNNKMGTNTAKFNTKSYNINSSNISNTSGNNNDDLNHRFKSVNGRTFDNYENVRIENQRFIDEMNKNINH